MLDMEKIEYVVKSRMVDQKLIPLFSGKFNQDDRIWIDTEFGKLYELIFAASDYSSAKLWENHEALKNSINSLYRMICDKCGCELGAKYLTDKFCVCVTLHEYVVTLLENEKAA